MLLARERWTRRCVRTTAGFNCVTSFPDHSADGSASHICRLLVQSEEKISMAYI